MEISINQVAAKDGTDILEINKNGKLYRMNSLYSPVKEAEKYAEQFKGIDNNSVLIVFGYGNGIFPQAIMNACASQVRVIFYEPTELVLGGAKQNCDNIKEILNNRGYLVVPKWESNDSRVVDLAGFPQLLESMIQYSNLNNVHYVTLPKYRDIWEEEYEFFVEQIQYRLQNLRVNAATAKVMGQSAVVNNIMNLRYVPDSYCADSFLGMFPSKMPAIIVSAGPSLEKNVGELKKAKGKALVLAVDSAVKYLLDADIIPDLMVSVDPQKPLNRFDDERINGIPVVGSSDMNYKVLEMLSDSKKIFCTTENSYIRKLFEHTGHKIECLKSGGSVATLAFSLCLYWGIETIVLVGQDLALTGGKMYVGTELQGNVSSVSPVQVLDIYGNKIDTTKEYYAYLKWFEQSICEHSDVRVIDATEGGAKIDGTEVLSLGEVLDSFSDTGFDFDLQLNKIMPAFSEADKNYACRKIKESKNKLLKLHEEFEEGIWTSQKGSQYANQGKIKDCQRIDLKLQNICDLYDSVEEDFVIQRQIDAMCLEEFMGLFEGLSADTLKEKYNRMKRYFEILNQATEKVLEIWDSLLCEY